MNWSTETSQPIMPRRRVRRPKSGRPSGPSARRATWSPAIWGFPACAAPASTSPASDAAQRTAGLRVTRRLVSRAAAGFLPLGSPAMRWAISGGAGFLGLHLARRLLREGHDVRTLDLAPLDEPELERSVEELRGDVRDPGAAARLCDGADVLVHAAAALPIQASHAAIRSVNVDGTAVTFAAALESGVRRAILVSSTAVYGIPKHHPLREDAPLVGVGWYGKSKIEAEE